MKVLLPVLLIVGLVAVDGHGAIVSPRSRNSVDFFATPSITGVDPCVNRTGAACNNGQSAHWYSQGCSIGCPTCDHVSGRRQIDICGNGKQPTLPDGTNGKPDFRSANRNATPGSEFDIYRHNPWRSPGNAPVADACGLAGGTPWGPDAPEEGRYKNTSAAHHGMKGTDLPELPTGVQWKIGGEAEVTWQVRNNHGGGYSYRLCPATGVLSEACFQDHPLDFVRDKQALVLNNFTKIPIQGLFVDEGTSPTGSTWALLPTPPNGFGPRCICSPDNNYHPANFDCGCKMGEQHDGCRSPGNCSLGACLPCPGTPGSDCSRCDNGQGATYPVPWQNEIRGRVAILDYVKVPSELPPGKYILGFRYDCEATAQVWSNCADIELVA